MSDFVIVTDSSCDLPMQIRQELNLQVAPLCYRLKEKEYPDVPDGELDSHSFYDLLRAGNGVTTSAANAEDFIRLMEPPLKEGKDVLCIAFSSGLSATFTGARIAAQELSEKYPDRKVYAIDSLCASMGQGLLVWLAGQQREQGKTIDEVYQWVLATRPHLAHWFIVEDLGHLRRGGRISAATAVVGTALGIRPVLHVDDEGHLINMEKARGRTAAIKALLKKMEQTALPGQRAVFISHGDCLGDAQSLAAQIKSRFDVPRVEIGNVGPVIGAHSGPGTLALFFLAEKR